MQIKQSKEKSLRIRKNNILIENGECQKKKIKRFRRKGAAAPKVEGKRGGERLPAKGRL